MTTCTGLKIWLIKRRITYTKIAEETGLHKNTISTLVKSGRGNNSSKKLVQLYLGIEKEEFDELLNLV